MPDPVPTQAASVPQVLNRTTFAGNPLFNLNPRKLGVGEPREKITFTKETRNIISGYDLDVGQTKRLLN